MIMIQDLCCIAFKLATVSMTHVTSPDAPDSKKLVCYDIDVEVDDPVKSKMQTFVGTPSNQQEISSLDQKVSGTVCLAYTCTF